MKSVRGTIPAHILRRIAELRQLETVVQDCLPAECYRHCRVAGVSNGVLTLVVDSPAWRARLHFYSSRIIRDCRRSGKFGVERVRVRVGRPDPVSPPAPRRDAPRRLPPASARAFAALAELTADPELCRALERLASDGDGNETR